MCTHTSRRWRRRQCDERVQSAACVHRVRASQFALVAPLLPKATRRKIKLVSAARTGAELQQEIDASELPASLGGARPDEATLMPRTQPF